MVMTSSYKMNTNLDSYHSNKQHDHCATKTTSNQQRKDSILKVGKSVASSKQANDVDEAIVLNDGSPSPSSSIVSVVSATAADYAPSPNTCNQALDRANQLRVQSMLRQLLAAEDEQRLSLLRLLRKLLRQLNYKLGWLAQVDLLETIERLLLDETSSKSGGDSTWRVLNDATQLLTEAIPRLAIEPDWISLEPILGLVVENLGHSRSELRRSSLLLINFLVNHYNNLSNTDKQQDQRFQQLLQLLINRGLTNCHNEQAQKGAILSLPLIMSRQTVEAHDLLPLVRALADLLVGSQPKLFYSLFLCLQRVEQTLGERRFMSYLNQCQPEAKLLYKQAASRNNSLASNVAATPRESIVSLQANNNMDASKQAAVRQSQQMEQNPNVAAIPSRQVTFEEQQTENHDINSMNQRIDDDDVESEAETIMSQNGLGANCETPSFDVDRNQQDNYTLANDLELTRETTIAGSPIESVESASSPCSVDDQQQPIYQPGTMNHQASSSRPTDLFSEVSSNCSSEAHLVNPAHYMNQAALNGRPLELYLNHHSPAGKLNTTNNCHYVAPDDGLAINTLGVCCSPTVDMGGPQSIELRFGIFPKHLIQVALSMATGRHHHQDRLEALNEMMCIIRDSPINHLAILTSYLEPFIDQFLARLLEAHADYQCGLIAIDMIETIVIKTKLSTLQYVRPMVHLLVRALADTRNYYRENTIRVIHKMMAYLPPQHVIDALFEHKHHRSALVREQLVDRVTGAILTYDRQEFNLTKLCYHVLPLLADHSSNVRLAAIECIASLAHGLGPDRIGTLLTAAEAVQTGCDYDGLLDAIQARLMRRTLPRCNPDGSIRHVIKPFLSQAQSHLHQEHRAADVRWVKEAPSSHQHLHHQPNTMSEDSAEHPQTHSPNIVHAHRPGVYSPTIGVEMSNNRRVSVAPVEIGETSKYHRDQANGIDRNDSLATNFSNDETTTTNVDTNDDDNGRKDGLSENCGRRKSVDTRKTTEDQQSGTRRNHSSSMDNNNNISREPKRPSLARCSRDSRSGSSDSNNSNKILFQYYLGKFRQSLSGPNGIMASSMSVLPSDSIIYSDTVQAYELTRRRSRQQQTSFDYDSDSVGQIPLATTTYKTTHSEINSRNSKISRSSKIMDPESLNYDNSSRDGQSNKKELSRRSTGGSKELNQSLLTNTDDDRHQETSNNGSLVEDQKITTRNSSIVSASRRKSNGSEMKDDQLNAANESAEHSETIRTQTTSNRRSLQKDESRHSGEEGAIEPSEAISDNQPDSTTTTSNGQARRKSSNEQQRGPLEVGGGEQIIRNKGSQEIDEPSGEQQQQQDFGDQQQEEISKQLQDDEEQQSLSSAASRKSDRQSRSRKKSEHQGFEDVDSSPSDNGASMLNKKRQAKSQPPDRNRTHTNSSPNRQHSNQKQQNNTKRLTQKSSTRSMFSDHLDSGESTASASRSDNNNNRRAVSVSPGSINGSMNIREILETVAENEGPFQEPMLAMRVALDALGSNCWSTKVEGILAIIRLAAHHPQVMMSKQHEIVTRVAHETTNLRSTVSRAAIFALGDFSAKLGRSLEPDLDCIVQALLHKACENTAFIRDDIRRSFNVMLDHITQWRLATSLINHGASHKNLLVRRMASQFIAALVQRMGPAKCLVGARDISSQLLPAAAKITQDSSPHTRYHGRLIVATLLQHGSFDRLMRKNLTPSLYRSCLGIMESIKRRGPGEPPSDF